MMLAHDDAFTCTPRRDGGPGLLRDRAAVGAGRDRIADTGPEGVLADVMPALQRALRSSPQRHG
jgi:hypothetical protein